MSEELKPCPFCGGKAGHIVCQGVYCMNDSCFMYHKDFATTESWNTRPCEEALQKRIDELEDKVSYLECDIKYNEHEYKERLKVANMRVFSLEQQNKVMLEEITDISRFYGPPPIIMPQPPKENE